MLESDFRDLVLSQKYFKDSNIDERRKAVKRKWTQLSTNGSTKRRIRTINGGLPIELHDLAVFLAFLKHDEKSPSERESENHWKEVAALLWNGQIEAYPLQEQSAIAKSLKSACPPDMITFLTTARNVWEQPGEGKSLKQRATSSRLGTKRAAVIPTPSGAPAVGTETDSADASASLETASLAMQSVGQLIEDLLPSGKGAQQPKPRNLKRHG
ncbi:hypothetical protein COCOBI_19-2120 [Coccomyxa sp. Obi]|nr:hypothetical protein COCOBI_19-2120 [Coccomyxa sp. Obi]